MTHRKYPPVRRSLFLYFGVFSIVLLAILWALPLMLFKRSYYATARGRMERAADDLASLVESSDYRIDRDARGVATRYDISLLVYTSDGRRVAACVNSLGSVLGELDNPTVNELFRDARETKAGVYRLFADDAGTDPTRSVYARVYDSALGRTYLILTECATSPLDSTFTVLITGLSIASVAAILLAASLSYLFSKRLSRPIRRITASARALANGDYGENFRGDGHRETAELADTLNYAARELSRVDRLQKELIANISHDLRTPLTTIGGYAEMMRDIDGENTKENADQIVRETKRLAGLVSDVLDLSRYKAGHAEPNKTDFDLVALTRSVLASLPAREDGEWNVSAEAPDSMPVNADYTAIERVLRNLISNAINYSPAGSPVRVRVTDAQGRAHVEVVDCGDGIAESELPNIWERYYRSEEDHVRCRVGSGLGLPIVREILVAHGAAYGVESRVGEGSTFWFELPRA